MSNEISYQFQVLLTNGKLKDQYASNSISATQSTAALMRNVQAISNAAHSALAFAGVTIPGFMVVQNLDVTNYVEIGVDVAAVFYPFMKLKAGEQGMLRLSNIVPYAKADTAPVDLFYIVYAN